MKIPLCFCVCPGWLLDDAQWIAVDFLFFGDWCDSAHRYVDNDFRLMIKIIIIIIRIITTYVQTCQTQIRAYLHTINDVALRGARK